MLKNGQTYFKNLGVFTPHRKIFKVFLTIFQHYGNIFYLEISLRKSSISVKTACRDAFLELLPLMKLSEPIRGDWAEWPVGDNGLVG